MNKIIMITQGEYLRLRLDNLLVSKRDQEITIPLSDIALIIIENLETIITARLLDQCATYNIAVITCNYKHHPSVSSLL